MLRVLGILILVVLILWALRRLLSSRKRSDD
jgi:flagellar biogenesis protein FliO